MFSLISEKKLLLPKQMKIKLVKVKGISGDAAVVYTVERVYDKTRFINDFFFNYRDVAYKIEVQAINRTLRLMGSSYGVRENWVKGAQGKLGDGACYIKYPKFISNHSPRTARLYCIRYGTEIIIVGSGCIKPIDKNSTQQVPECENERTIIEKLSKLISARIADGEISFKNVGNVREFVGNLEFDL